MVDLLLGTRGFSNSFVPKHPVSPLWKVYIIRQEETKIYKNYTLQSLQGVKWASKKSLDHKFKWSHLRTLLCWDESSWTQQTLETTWKMLASRLAEVDGWANSTDTSCWSLLWNMIWASRSMWIGQVWYSYLQPLVLYERKTSKILKESPDDLGRWRWRYDCRNSEAMERIWRYNEETKRDIKLDIVEEFSCEYRKASEVRSHPM